LVDSEVFQKAVGGEDDDTGEEGDAEGNELKGADVDDVGGVETVWDHC